MKRYLLSIIFLMFFIIPTSDVDALYSYEIDSRIECPVIELAEAKEDGSLTKIECYDNYQAAKEVMNQTENDNLVLIESGMIIDAKYAVIDYEVDLSKSTNGYIDVFVSKDSNTTNGYIKGGTPDDAALIEIDYDTKRVKIKIAGLVGWINRFDNTLRLYDIVPLVWAKSPQSYTVTENNLIHVFPGNVYGNTGTSLTIDKKPSMLDVGTYYSYDGHYFYTDMKILLTDYKNNNYENAINKDNPYYNYYQYLSFRTKTNYTKENINDYLSSRITDTTSKMLLTGEYFINTQNNYGINAILMMGIGMNESGRGRSTIAQTKNNLFGLNAVDKTPGESADYFTSIENCIDEFGYVWLSYGFIQPGDYRFKGDNLGNKIEGLNLKYASDPFWAEKAAAFYYDIDSMYDFQDYNTYQLAVLNNDYNNTVYAKKTPGGENIYGNYYEYKLKDSPVVILEEVEGPEVSGNKVWYKIQSDATLDENQSYIGDSKSDPKVKYNFEKSYAYVSAAYFIKINTKENITTKPVEPPIDETKPEPETPPPKAISSIVQEANYKYENGNISGISPNTSIETIKNNLTNTGGVITITDASGNLKETGNIGTGDKVNITSGSTETLTVLIYGDTNGDGNISAVDYVKIKNHIMGSNILTDVYTKTADVNNDGNISAVDYVNIKNYIMGTDNVIKN